MLDYIIVGQGICGSFLSYYLLKEGSKICVIDELNPRAASYVASGIINPVTGRRVVKTWLIDELLSFALKAYTNLSDEFNTTLIRQCNVLDFFATPQMKEAFESRIIKEPELLKLQNDTGQYEETFRFNYGVGEIDPCYLIDVQNWLSLWRKQLQKNNALYETKFDLAKCNISKEGIRYEDIHAYKIIFCDGTAAAQNPYFNKLPFAFNKGEALLINIPDLSPANIYKQGLNIVPWKEKDLFWVGSNYIWNYNDLQPTEDFRKKTEEHLKYWLRLPFSTVDHIASERPANVERRPFAGLHPIHSSVGILNGTGTKGCSLAPFFACQLAQHLLYDCPIEPLADVSRFARILSR